MKGASAAMILVFSAFLSSCPGEAGTGGGAFKLTGSEKDFLKDLARLTLVWKVKYGKVPELDPAKLSKNLKSNVGCFVTLEKRQTGLRGCIGMFEPSTPLYQNVITRAVAAAFYDSRFPTVRPDELADIEIEVSVLTPPQPLEYKDPQDLLSKLVPLKHGVILTTRKGSSTYLPQVWKQLPTKEQFLSRLCMKHGSLPSCWKQGPERTKVDIYEAVVFGEKDYGRVVVGPDGGVVGKGGAVFSAQSPLDRARGKACNYRKGQHLQEGAKLPPGTILEPGADIR